MITLDTPASNFKTFDIGNTIIADKFSFEFTSAFCITADCTLRLVLAKDDGIFTGENLKW